MANMAAVGMMDFLPRAFRYQVGQKPVSIGHLWAGTRKPFIYAGFRASVRRFFIYGLCFLMP